MDDDDAADRFATFSDEEAATLAEHQIAVFRDKLILDARPPITDIQVAALKRRIGIDIPAGLLQLWRVAYGGGLDYELTVPLGEHIYSASMQELFFPGSDGYHDLFGWIEHEKDAFDEPPVVLELLPFGGFEYLERFYVETRGTERGRVWLWAQGLPPAWKGALNEDTAAPVAPSIAGLFDMLELEQDPRTALPDTYPSGLDMVAAIDGLREDDPALAERLDAILTASIFDWRGLVEHTTCAGTQRHLDAARLALAAACDHDEVALLDTLIEQGFPVDIHVAGEATALAVAISKGANKVAHRLLQSGQPLGDTTVIHTKKVDVALVDALVHAGVRFDVESVLSAGADGDLDAAERIARSGARHGPWPDLLRVVAERSARERETADEVETGHAASYATPAEHRAMAGNLDALADRLRVQ